MSRSVFYLDWGDAEGEESGVLQGLAMVGFAEVMRAVPSSPDTFEEILGAADDIADDIVKEL